MAEKEAQEIVVIRRRLSLEEEPHGGAWKIAFADFMTAMMALFLVLWLISSTSDKTKRAVAQYFNPVKLVDMTTLKKGFQDPKETEMGAGPSIREATTQRSTNRSPLWMREASSETAAKTPTHSETALFRDPYAVLAEIVANARAEAPKFESETAQGPMGAPSDLAETFTDPFTTVPHVPEPKVESSAPQAQGKSAQAAEAEESRPSPEPREPAVAVRAPEKDAKPKARPNERAGGEASQAKETEAAKLSADIQNAVQSTGRPQDLPRIEVQGTSEGVLISLTDDVNYMMFAIGSAEPLPKTIAVMEKIGRLLKTRSGSIVIRGHTDGRPYKSEAYDNWRLSAARAHMAHYMLVRGGLDEKRFEKIEGYADRRLKFPSDPTAAGNRRIEILLRKDKP